MTRMAVCFVILTEFSPGMHLIQFLANKIQYFRNFILHYCIVFLTLNKVP